MPHDTNYAKPIYRLSSINTKWGCPALDIPKNSRFSDVVYSATTV